MLGDTGLLGRHYSHGFRASLLVVLLVAVTVAGVAVAPRALARLGDRELRHALDTASATQLDLTGLGRLGFDQGSSAPNVGGPYGATDIAIRNVRLALPQPLQGLVGDPHWLVRSSASTVTLPGNQPLTADLRLTIDLAWERIVRIVDGELPPAYDGHGPIGVAVPRPLADRLDLHVRDRLPQTRHRWW